MCSNRLASLVIHNESINKSPDKERFSIRKHNWSCISISISFVIFKFVLTGRKAQCLNFRVVDIKGKQHNA